MVGGTLGPQKLNIRATFRTLEILQQDEEVRKIY